MISPRGPWHSVHGKGRINIVHEFSLKDLYPNKYNKIFENSKGTESCHAQKTLWLSLQSHLARPWQALARQKLAATVHEADTHVATLHITTTTVRITATQPRITHLLSHSRFRLSDLFSRFSSSNSFNSLQRLNNSSQLAGFAKKDDLRYFLNVITGIDYESLPDLAPTDDMLTAYKKQKGDWSLYEKQFLDLIRSRKIETTARRELFDHGCLLCSEDKPHHCHRRIVAEYLAEKWGDVEIMHLT